MTRDLDLMSPSDLAAIRKSLPAPTRPSRVSAVVLETPGGRLLARVHFPGDDVAVALAGIQRAVRRGALPLAIVRIERDSSKVNPGGRPCKVTAVKTFGETGACTGWKVSEAIDPHLRALLAAPRRPRRRWWHLREFQS